MAEEKRPGRNPDPKTRTLNRQAKDQSMMRSYQPNVLGKLGKAALAYAERGVPVFPCMPGGKAPLTKSGHLEATTDRARLNLWWRRWPRANIGIPTGERSGLLVLDIDADKGGFASLEEWEVEEPMPETAMVRTGRGGIHYYFSYPADGSRIPNSASKLGPGLDVRGEGGYVLAPPSRTEGDYAYL